MTDRMFPILGATVAPMLGRTAIISRIVSSLTKQNPDHLQLVGPRFSGKTVILHELARRMLGEKSLYDAVLLWDLGHQSPRSDDEFMKQLCLRLADALSEKNSDYAQHLRASSDNEYQDIAEVLESLKAEGTKILVLLDGFDKPLSNGNLTRNLWDQLRELALKPSLRLVTASRNTLRELLRDPDAQTSDFWNIFDPSPIRVGCFNDDDLREIVGHLKGLTFSSGAITELWNASNGCPIILLEILNKLNCKDGATFQNTDVTNAVDLALDGVRSVVENLWCDCTLSAQEVMRQVAHAGQLSRAGIPAADADMLAERGFVQVSGNKLQRPGRLLKAYLASVPNEGSSLDRMFGNDDSYRKNFRSVLESRIKQIPQLDSTLRHYLERGVSDFPDHPEVFLSNVRGIINRSFELICAVELPNRRIPSEWMSIWRHNQERGIDEWETRFPQGAQRLRLLQLMTGTDKSDACAKHLTKNTHVLMNALYAFGDFGQHSEGVSVDIGTGYAALKICIELCAAVARELSLR